MSERMPADISIGGQFAAELVPELCAAITSQGVSLDWGEGQFLPSSDADLLDARSERGGVLVLWLCADQALCGCFEDLETFLRRHGVPYTRRSDGKDEFNAEMVEYRPQTGAIERVASTTGQAMVYPSELEPIDGILLEAIKLMRAGAPAAAISSLESARTLLREKLLLDLPPLPTFEIVGTATADQKRLRIRLIDDNDGCDPPMHVGTVIAPSCRSEAEAIHALELAIGAFRDEGLDGGQLLNYLAAHGFETADSAEIEYRIRA
jgi:hypothetical protein